MQKQEMWTDSKDSFVTERVLLFHHDQMPHYAYENPDLNSPQALHERQQPLTPEPYAEANRWEDVLLQYQSQPDLLQLILLSKLEEDKRRKEEARMHAKQLDLLLLQQQMDPVPYYAYTGFSLDLSPPISSSSSTDGPGQEKPIGTACAMLASPPLSSRQARVTAEYPMADADAMATSIAVSTLSTAPLMPVFSQSMTEPMKSIKPEAFSQSMPIRRSSPSHSESHVTPHLRRRRREMQAITKIVETRDNPYADGYCWKNNGNTIQRKTGNKSVYYKCSNGAKGCPVNKTVTRRENGEYIIKYRGDHLPDCSKVQRIVDV